MRRFIGIEEWKKRIEMAMKWSRTNAEWKEVVRIGLQHPGYALIDFERNDAGITGAMERHPEIF